MMDSQEDQVLLVNKPLQWTSFDVIRKVRNQIKVKKIGHAGTLDPLATGLLVLCTGKMTKKIEEIQAQEKEYTGKMIIGQTTPSVDRETQTTSPVDTSHITCEVIKNTAAQFTGVMQQVPPIYSAVKVDGVRAYTLARSGKSFTLRPRKVKINHFEVDASFLPEVTFRITCSKGFYIRSLVRDFGDRLNVGAYLSELCRTRIGKFSLQNAVNINQL